MTAQPGFAATWLRQRVTGAAAVAEIERAELAALDEETALRYTEAVLSLPMPPLSDERRTSSGFVEQQRLFSRARSSR